MATSCTGFYILQPSTLRLKSSSCTTLSIARLCCARNAHLQNRSKNLYWKRPLLWEKVVSRRALTCNFFRQPVEEDKAADNDERNELEPERQPFDLNMAVVLAGFAFEAYTTPTEKVGVREIDAGECETVFLSEQFLHEVYDGQLLVKLKKGVNLPAMDPWGTSDPYVVMQLGDCVVKSKIIWAAKEPNWNENFKLNVKDPTTKYLQVAVWDANLITPHKRMGNGGVKLESLCDGNMYDIQVELEGIGGGGLVYLEVNYEAFEDIKAKKSGWWIPFLSDIVLAKGLESSLKRAFGTDSVRARDFVRSAFGQLQPLFDIAKFETNEESEGKSQSKMFSENILNESNETGLNEVSDMNYRIKSGSTSQKVETDEVKVGDERNSSKGERLSNLTEAAKDQRNDGNIWSSIVTESSISPDFDFWKILAENINQTVEKFGVNNFGFPALESVRWNGNEMIKKLGLQSQTLAEQQYVGSGLATPKQNMGDDHSILMTETQEPHSTTMDVKQVSYDVLRQTENILGSLMMITASLTGHKNDSRIADGEVGKGNTTAIVTDRLIESPNSGMVGYDSVAEPLTNGRLEEMKKMFASAESAMEAWAVLATALGRASFIKSEFEKICFLDNGRTDTQVAIWRDTSQQRLVIAFRGTEQVRWKDLRTDLMLAPAGLNPERMGGDFKEEVQVHSGFLNAYDSVRSRLLSFIKTSISFKEGEEGKTSKWHVYVTGHSLGGALATLLALELSSSQMAKSGRINVTMYNFGSPRVGNKRFAEAYNEKVKDSWRVVNHRDIIPSVPRLMGYCHVAQPVYLTAGDLQDASVDMEILADGYEGDIIGESTPDVIVSEFMKGEKQLIDKLLQTEINLFRAIRDGSALMQHMEDFYYITLLERVRSKYLRQ